MDEGGDALQCVRSLGRIRRPNRFHLIPHHEFFRTGHCPALAGLSFVSSICDGFLMTKPTASRSQGPKTVMAHVAHLIRRIGLR